MTQDAQARPSAAAEAAPVEFPRPRRLDLSGFSTPSEIAAAKRRHFVGLALRFGLLVLGMAVAAFGIAMVAASGIGGTPIAAVPLALTGITGISYGATTFIVNAAFVAGEYALLRRKFPLWNLVQIPSVFLFSVFVGTAYDFLLAHPPANYALELGESLAGSAFLALGILMQVRSKTLMQPGEGIVFAAAIVFRRSFSTMKIANDCSLVAIAAVLGLVFLGELYQIREGTLLSAVLVGLLVKLFDRIRRRITGVK